MGEGVEEDDEDSRLEAALRGELKTEAAKAEDNQVRNEEDLFHFNHNTPFPIRSWIEIYRINIQEKRASLWQ